MTLAMARPHPADITHALATAPWASVHAPRSARGGSALLAVDRLAIARTALTSGPPDLRRALGVALPARLRRR